ncbi:MAG: aspartate-semialdehyde dehydrogenase [Longimicrobiales bacterium]
MKLAVLGVTGAVGRTMLQVLDERGFRADELVPLASERSAGEPVRWRERDWLIRAPSPDAFDGCSVALFSAGAERSREWAPVAAERGAVVIDNSSAWRLNPSVPLVVPEVNGAAVGVRPLNIIANPNCSTIQMVVALEAVRRAAGLRRVVASTYQSVSGAGQEGIDALRAELGGATSSASPFAAPIAGNAIPRIGALDADGWTDEEEKMRSETRKILGLAELPVAATCVRVPVEIGHCVAVTVETEQEVVLDEVRTALRSMPGVCLVEDREPLPREVAGSDAVLVGRLRSDRDLPRTLHFWVVADNLRKGAATNAVQIAERLKGD